MKPPRIARSPLLAALRRLQQPIDTVPPGWHTVVEWAAAWGLARAQTNRLLREGEQAGLLERRTFRIDSGSRVYPVPHYREKKARAAS